MASLKRPKSSASSIKAKTYPQEIPVVLEGWVKQWEGPSGIPSADLSWLKEENGLFKPAHMYEDTQGKVGLRRLMKSDCMWFYPPEPPGFVSGSAPAPKLFFRSRVFVWHPVRMWRYLLKCPQGDKCLGRGQNVHLYQSGYHTQVRHVCDVSNWYTVITEVLCCGPCTKAASGGEDSGKSVKWCAWDTAILSQLSEAHQAMFPAILTSKRGVDRNVLRLLRNQTDRNTMVKVWRQIQESHTEEYFRRMDLYTSLLMTIKERFGQEFQAPPPPRELPSARLLRHAFLLAEANNVQRYRSQILSTFGTVLKLDSSNKVVKKLSGECQDSAECFTSIRNEDSQIVSFVLTCEESTVKLSPMCRGVMERFKLADQPVPKVLYVDHGCCCAQGSTAVETLFASWVDRGMVVRLDIFHWIHRFDAAITTESHSKYRAFKSALAGAVMAFNQTDMELLIRAGRAKNPALLQSVSDKDIVKHHITREQLKHHVRRVTLGAQETFRLIHLIIEELKGQAGLDESGASLFKTSEAIDAVWGEQKRHLECIQDPPGMSMYQVTHTTSINGVNVPYYKCLRGNSLEGFHKVLPNMIPGPHCAARPYQAYLMSGIARWNSDRSSDAASGARGWHYKTYSAPVVDRLNTHCQHLFGETVEENFWTPAAVSSNELLGLEYLYSQITGEDGAFSLDGIVNDGPAEEEEVVQPGQPDPDEADETNHSDGEHVNDILAAGTPHIMLTTEETSSVYPPAFEDVCSLNPLPGLENLESFCSLLVDMGLTEDKPPLTSVQRVQVLEAWSQVEEHDKQPVLFDQLYRAHWGNTLYCCVKKEDLDDDVVQWGKPCPTPQQEISAEMNRLMYVVVKLLWLRLSAMLKNPDEHYIVELYERIHHRLFVEDPVLSKVGIQLQKIDRWTVQEYIHRQERIRNLNVTTQLSMDTKLTSVSSPMPQKETVSPPPNYPVISSTFSLAGSTLLKITEAPKIASKRLLLALQAAPPVADLHRRAIQPVPLPVNPTAKPHQRPIQPARRPVLPTAKPQPRPIQPAPPPDLPAAGPHTKPIQPDPQPVLPTAGPHLKPIKLEPESVLTADGSHLKPIEPEPQPVLTADGPHLKPIKSEPQPVLPVDGPHFKPIKSEPQPVIPTAVPHTKSIQPNLLVLPNTSQPNQPALQLLVPITGPHRPVILPPPQPVRTFILPPTRPIQPAPVVQSYSRSTFYRKKREARVTLMEVKMPRLYLEPICVLCKKSTQGHLNFKKKVFCPATMRSPSKGLEKEVFLSYEDFKSTVNALDT